MVRSKRADNSRWPEMIGLTRGALDHPGLTFRGQALILPRSPPQPRQQRRIVELRERPGEITRRMSGDHVERR